MAGFTIRCNGDKVYQEQLRQLAVRREAPLAQLVREALDQVYGQDLSQLYDNAFFVVSGGHKKDQRTRRGRR